MRVLAKRSAEMMSCVVWRAGDGEPGGSGPRGKVQGAEVGMRSAGRGGRGRLRKLWSGSAIPEGSGSCQGDDEAQGVGGWRGAEVKVTGPGGGVGRDPQSWRPPRVSSAPSLPLLPGASLPRFWGSAQPPGDSQMGTPGPRLSPSVLPFLFCPPPNLGASFLRRSRRNVSQTELVFFLPNPSPA